MASWKNEELISGKKGLAQSIVLPTCGCRYDACYMCSYRLDCPDTTPKTIVSDMEGMMDNSVDRLKLFTSGSFLDTRELSLQQQKEIAEIVEATDISSLTVESRPEFITEETLESLLSGLGNTSLEVAIGLESANNDVLRYCVNKGFTFERFCEKADLIHDYGGEVKAYLLLKPPLVSEYEAMIDVIESAHRAEAYSDTISINPVSIHKMSVVESLWKRGSYRPPYLWTLVACLNELRDLTPYVLSHPVGVGKPRGIHNCGVCERPIMAQVDRYNLGDRSKISYECSCLEKWEEELKKIF